MRNLFAVLLICLVTPTSLAHERSDKTKCDKIKQQIRQVESKMRAGYTRAQGEKLDARLRKLRADRAKSCR